MYRCGVCGACSKPGQSRRVHVVHRVVPASVQQHRTRGHDGRAGTRAVFSPQRAEVAREVPVCERCEQQLQRQAAQPRAGSNGAPEPVSSGRTVRTVRG